MSLFTMTLQRREMFFSVLYSLNALCSSPPLIRLWFLALHKELALGFSAADTCVGNMSSHIHLDAAGAGTT
jgi:hypothetical protein